MANLKLALNSCRDIIYSQEDMLKARYHVDKVQFDVSSTLLRIFPGLVVDCICFQVWKLQITRDVLPQLQRRLAQKAKMLQEREANRRTPVGMLAYNYNILRILSGQGGIVSPENSVLFLKYAPSWCNLGRVRYDLDVLESFSDDDE